MTVTIILESPRSELNRGEATKMLPPGAAAEEAGNLGTRPSRVLVKESRKAISRIESELRWKMEAIAAISNPPDIDVTLCLAAKAAMEAEAKRVAEEEKARHISVIQLEEFYQISRAEADLEGNMKLDVKELLHELRMLILFNVPDTAQRLSAIAKLDLSKNDIQCLPESVTSLVNLKTLDVHSNQLTSLPHSMGRLSNLKTLNISGNFFDELPECVQNCSSLEELIADCNKLQRLPDALGFKLLNLQKLSVHSNKLSNLPSSISHLMSLRLLDVHKNKLKHLPEDLEKLVSLQILNISYNCDNFTALPNSICGLTSLVELDVSYNQIKRLPDMIGGLEGLKRLNLEGNPIILPPPKIVSDGLQAVKNYMRNRATKSFLSRGLSLLGRKLPPKCIACTGGSVAFGKRSNSWKGMTCHEAKYQEEGLSSPNYFFTPSPSPSALHHL